MSLATRCTACGTVFRVVQDQLKVSEGWVRCGRCSEVFNALPGLFDLSREAPPSGVAGPAADGPVPVDPAAPTRPADEARPPPAGIDALRHDRLDAQLLSSPDLAAAAADGSTPAMRIGERDRLEFPDARYDPDAIDADPLDPRDADPRRIDAHAADPREAGLPAADPQAADPHPATDSTPATEPLDHPGARPDPAAFAAASSFGEPVDTATEMPPDFLRYAQRRRQQRGRHPVVTGLLSTAAALLAVLLGLQVVHHQRDTLAARWPAAAPALAAACGLLHCTVQAPRRIDDILVETSSMTRAALPDAFRLAIGLRNRGTMRLALPSVDLSLTDPAGLLVARRVLSPLDFKAPPAGVIGPGADLALQLVFQADRLRVTGYTVEIFYP